MENHKFDWTPAQIEQAAVLFNQGTRPTEVAEIMNQKIIDVGLLLIHLFETGKIKNK